MDVTDPDGCKAYIVAHGRAEPAGMAEQAADASRSRAICGCVCRRHIRARHLAAARRGHWRRFLSVLAGTGAHRCRAARSSCRERHDRLRAPARRLSGWFIAGRPGGGAVVLMHGVRGNRLAMLRRARLLHAEGFSVLLFDFQAHGESTGAAHHVRPPRRPGRCGRRRVRAPAPAERADRRDRLVARRRGRAAWPGAAAGRCAGARIGLSGHRLGDRQSRPRRARPGCRRRRRAADRVAVRGDPSAVPRHTAGGASSDRPYRAWSPPR